MRSRGRLCACLSALVLVAAGTSAIWAIAGTSTAGASARDHQLAGTAAPPSRTGLTNGTGLTPGTGPTGTTARPTTTLPQAPPAVGSVPPSHAYVLVDVNTGNVLAGYHEHLRLPPASLTKILTALIAVGYLPADAGVAGTAVSERAYPNQVGMEKGVAWPLGDVLQSLLVLSANDAAYAIAQRVSGSLSAFEPVMQRAAFQIGMSDSPVFRDPAGLDGTEGVAGGNLASARDLAIAGRDLLAVPELAKIVAEQSYAFVDPTGTPHDLPSMDYTFLESYVGAVGIKTGYTDRAGSCIVAAAKRGNRTMLAVVMNGYNPTATAIDLLNQGFATAPGVESAADQLPPVSFPSPPGPSLKAQGRPLPGTQGRTGTAPSSPAGQRGTARARAGAGSAVGAGHGSGARDRTGRAPHQGQAGPTANAGGLRSVLRAWPARALLFTAGLGVLLALWELLSANRLQQRRRQAAVMYGSSPHPLPRLNPSRRRREQIVASYRRHEHPQPAKTASPRH